MFMGGHPTRTSGAARVRGPARERLAASFWPTVWSVVSALSIWVFARDVLVADWPAWALPPLMVAGFWAVVLTMPEDSSVRNVLHASALLLVPFMAIYCVIDAVFGMNWLAWTLSPVLVIGFWWALLDVADAEFD